MRLISMRRVGKRGLVVKPLIRGLMAVLLFCLSACGPQNTKPVEPNNITLTGIEALTPSQRQEFKQAVVYLEAEQWQQAAGVFQSLSKQQPGIASLWMNLALAQYQLEQWPQAHGSLDRVFKLTRSSPQAYNLAGLVAVATGDFKDAQYQYEQALKLQPQYANALYNMALLHDVYLQNVAEAVVYYQRYLDIEKLDKDTRAWVEQLQLSLNR